MFLAENIPQPCSRLRHLDGQRFLLLLAPDGATAGAPQLTVIANWQGLLAKQGQAYP